MSDSINVAILEDHQSVIDGDTYRLQNSARFKIAGVSNFYSDWDALLAQHTPQVALMDVRVPTAPDNPNPNPILHVMPRLIETYLDTDFLVIAAYPKPTNGYVGQAEQRAMSRLISRACCCAGPETTSAGWWQPIGKRE